MSPIPTQPLEDFLVNGKNHVSGRFNPEPDTEMSAAMDVLNSGLTGAHIKDHAMGLSQIASLKFLVFTGKNGAGACTLTGANVGDKVINLVNLSAPANAESSFEATITVKDQIQQSSASDLHTDLFLVFLISPAAI